MSAVGDLKRDGYIILKNYIPQSDLNTCIQRLESLYADHWSSADVVAKAAPIGIQNLIKNDRVINNVFLYDDIFLRLASTGVHRDIIGALFNDIHYRCIPENEHNYILSQFNARDGQSALPFHVDVRLQIGNEKTWSLQCLLSVDKLDAENGALRVRPGSHLDDGMPDSKRDYDDSVTLETDPGDLIIFYSNLHHATCPNRSARRGWTLLLTYRAWWCKQQFDIWGMMKNKAHHLTKQQQLLLGGCSVPSTDPYSSLSLRTGYEALEK
ncbi:phytanoyl-CoA dioxygenase family protein [Herbaspirillum huttiense]|uniref:phytanoyl-CoA dioxygenase family protein n=1 Tax=Herbaspirillum huttiense TaxID=863372 RepID=UPI0039B0CB7F